MLSTYWIFFCLGTASVARGLSNYIDALADHKIREAFRDWMPMDVSFLSEYPDFLSFILVMLLTGKFILNKEYHKNVLKNWF